jgi:hypothetical protein
VPVLLLARGDPEARDLLRSAIEARYAVSPPALDNVVMTLNGRVRAKVGPIMTWVPVHNVASFRFPVAIRWDFIVRPVGVPVQRGIEAYDGSVYRQMRGRNQAEIVENEALVDSLQQRLWAIAAVLLTPLGEHFVELKATGPHSFNATNTQLDHTVNIHLRENDSVDRVVVECLNPDSEMMQRFSLILPEEQAPVNDIMLPRKIRASWDDQPYFEIEPTKIENLPSIADEVFTLEADIET